MGDIISLSLCWYCFVLHYFVLHYIVMCVADAYSHIPGSTEAKLGDCSVLINVLMALSGVVLNCLACRNERPEYKTQPDIPENEVSLLVKHIVEAYQKVIDLPTDALHTQDVASQCCV